jgi:hypothetical protein
MEVVGGQDALLSLGNPPRLGQGLAFGAVAISAGVVADLPVFATVRTELDVSSQSGCPAGFDGGHDLELFGAQGMTLTVGRPSGAKDVRDLQARPVPVGPVARSVGPRGLLSWPSGPD